MVNYSKNPAGLPLVVLGLGSNLGDSRLIILDAVKALENVLTELRAAPLYDTDPLHVTDQNRFVNTAVAGYFRDLTESQVPGVSSGPAWTLLRIVNGIEAGFGREREKERRWGERFLDIDILLFGSLTVNETGLEIPHPRLKERRFALEPMLELLPDACEPGTGLSYRAVCDALPDQGVRRID